MEDKRLLQTATMIGTDVPLSLLRALADVPDEALYRSLGHLQTAEFLYETHLFPEPKYSFKHALTHDVTYGSLLLERRRVAHARLSEALGPRALAREAEQVERLAQHAVWGEVWAKAVIYCQQAGTMAYDHAAFREAVELLRRAVESADREAGPSSTDARSRSRVQLARTLSDLGEFAAGRRHGKEALRFATQAGRGTTPVCAHTYLGVLYLAQGDLAHAIRVLEQSLALCRASGYRDLL